MATPNPSSQPMHGATPAAAACPATCPLCGGPNGCLRARAPVPGNCPAPSSSPSCWCFTIQIPGSCVARATDRGPACVCHACIAEAKRDDPWDARPGAGETYWLDDGRMVFTERYHLRRGFCCGNGCRHCPYDAHGRPRRDVLAAMDP